MNAARGSALDRRHRRRVIISTLIEVILIWVALFGIFYVVPFDDRTSTASVLRLALGISAFAAVLAWQLRRVKRAVLPRLQAIQALGDRDLARIAVSFQMLLDLVVIGAVVRLLTSAAKSGSDG